MSVNESDPDLDTRIKARAFQLWESEGRPEGREAEHWDQARQELAEEEGADEGQSRKAEIEHADAFKIAFGKA